MNISNICDVSKFVKRYFDKRITNIVKLVGLVIDYAVHIS